MTASKADVLAWAELNPSLMANLRRDYTVHLRNEITDLASWGDAHGSKIKAVITTGAFGTEIEVLERLPFPIGYGVETAHLVDLYQSSGLDAFAQTDLDNRIHRNQPTSDLGKMAFGILQGFMKRLRDYGMVKELPEFHGLFRQFQAEGHRYEQVTREIFEEERPPMITLPEYRERHGR